MIVQSSEAPLGDHVILADPPEVLALELLAPALGRWVHDSNNALAVAANTAHALPQSQREDSAAILNAVERLVTISREFQVVSGGDTPYTIDMPYLVNSSGPLVSRCLGRKIHIVWEGQEPFRCTVAAAPAVRRIAGHSWALLKAHPELSVCRWSAGDGAYLRVSIENDVWALVLIAGLRHNVS